MTISIPIHPTSTGSRSLVAYHHTLDGVKGYIVKVGTCEPVFVEEADADKFARYMLFAAPETKEES